jgi:hypothetical protein
MDFQDSLQRYFGQTEIDNLSAAALTAGMERARVDFGLERDPARRFALWTLLFMLGGAPDLDAAFKDPAERDAARYFMDMAARLMPE